jgi:hypothetical protein
MMTITDKKGWRIFYRTSSILWSTKTLVLSIVLTGQEARLREMVKESREERIGTWGYWIR